MHPTAHVVINIIALILLALLTIPRTLKRNNDARTFFDALFYIIIGALIGAWLFKAVPRLIIHLNDPAAYTKWWNAGQHWMGAITGGLLAGYVYCRIKDVDFWGGLDIFTPAVPLAQALGRIGCIINGDSYGRETDHWIGLWLPNTRGEYAMRYPAQHASIIANLVIAALLYSIERYISRKKKPGWMFDGFLFVLYAFLYSIQRFFLQFWRGDGLPLFGDFNWTHLYSLIWFVAAIGAFFILKARADNEHSHQ